MEARYNTLKDVKENREEENDQVTFSNVFVKTDDSVVTAWNVSIIYILMFTNYISLGLTIDRGDLSGPSGKLWTTNMLHRFGLEIGQSYRNNDSAFFLVKFAKDRFFPGLSYELGYCWVVTRSIKTCFEIQGKGFEEQDAYTATPLAFTKKYRDHELTVKPYWSASKYCKLNMVLAEKFYIQQKLGYLSFQGVTGYFRTTISLLITKVLQNNDSVFLAKAWLKYAEHGRCSAPLAELIIPKATMAVSVQIGLLNLG